ncbi:hypothetical protein MP228_004254 [Amoeboaphelidium protococcarum]|nr:hypothetical protein MP228_004254 [Amoeboaphelidium protococcarum]
MAANEQESSLFRSETMSLVQLYIPSELAHDSVAELGELGMVQFKDLNSGLNAFQRTFINELKRIDDLERLLRFFKTQLDKNDVQYKLTDPSNGASMYSSPASSSSAGDKFGVKDRSMQQMEELESSFQEYEQRLQQMNGQQEQLNKRYLELVELRQVLRECEYFFAQQSQSNGGRRGGSFNAPTSNYDDDYEESLLDQVEAGNRSSTASTGLQFVTGTLPRGRMQVFERILWRALRGNVFMDYAEISERIVDPVSEEEIEKNVFIVFAHGNELINKIKKITQSFGGTVYDVDVDESRRAAALRDVTVKLDDLRMVLDNGSATRLAELKVISRHIGKWATFVRKEKAIYSTMDMFNYDSTRKCLIAEGWCPSKSINAVQYALHSVSERNGSLVPPIVNQLQTHDQSPTYHKTNKFTFGFQAIIDSYGVATYKEVNPGLFTVITFPFLFAIMFGDLGHGLLVFFAGLCLVLNEKKMEQMELGEMVAIVFGGRYIVLLMGFFSMYVGLIYNDFFSLPLYMQSSGWDIEIFKNETTQVQSFNSTFLYPYAFGIDPAWRQADNSLLFLNSYKMKQSILIGVLHMCFGIILTVYNSRYFKRPLNLYHEFIPQLLFMLSIFGYLSFLIIFKWLYPWRVPGNDPPSLLNTLIYMFLGLGGVKEGTELFGGQAVVQTILLLVAVICVPWMLCVKPYKLYKQHQRNIAMGYTTIGGDSPGARSHDSEVIKPDVHVNLDGNGGASTAAAGGASLLPTATELQHGNGVADAASITDGSGDFHGGGEHGGKFEFGEIVIHQVIHTIEFCLGAISNTASYLRLWALSLAHAQLSEVLWEMTIQSTLSSVMLVAGFYMWFQLTVGILVGMEGLSAFLHALRLHWVEFNGKFYEGGGHPFTPFSFKALSREL